MWVRLVCADVRGVGVYGSGIRAEDRASRRNGSEFRGGPEFESVTNLKLRKP